jgi:hypothetical protein
VKVKSRGGENFHYILQRRICVPTLGKISIFGKFDVTWRKYTVRK